MDEPYTVVEDKGCLHCGAGITYDVMAPNGLALGVLYPDMYGAEWLAASLNTAYHTGQRSAQALVFIGKEGTPQELTKMQYSLSLPAPDCFPVIERTIREADNPEGTERAIIGLREFADEVRELVSSDDWKMRLGS